MKKVCRKHKVTSCNACRSNSLLSDTAESSYFMEVPDSYVVSSYDSGSSSSSYDSGSSSSSSSSSDSGSSW